jgi:hypothetical protein
MDQSIPLLTALMDRFDGYFDVPRWGALKRDLVTGASDMVRMLEDRRMSVWDSGNELNPEFAESPAPYSENFHFSAAYVVTVST